MIVILRLSSVCTGDQRRLKRAFSSPGITFGAPVPAVQVADLEGRRLEMLGAGIPGARRQFDQRGRDAMDRIVGAIRVRDVALDAVHREASRQRAAPADADRVAEAALAGRLADHAVVDALAARPQRLDDPARAVDGRAFLVARDQECDRSLECPARADERLGRRQHRGKPALHVGRAAAVQQAVANDRHEGIRMPLLERPGRHDVRVAGEAQERPVAAAAHGPEIVDLAEAHPLDRESERFEARNEQFLAAAVGGTDRLAGHELAGQFQGRRHRHAGYPAQKGDAPLFKGDASLYVPLPCGRGAFR